MSSDGFTLIELIVIIVLLGILTAVAAPKFFDLDGYRTRAAYDEVAGAVRYAQKLAVASGCEVQVVINANGYALQQRPAPVAAGSNCPDPTVAFADILDHPVTNNNLSPVTLSPAPQNLIFNAMGRCDTGTSITVGGSEVITIIAETGYVDAP